MPGTGRIERGRGAGGKTIVFGLFKRGGQVYTEIVPDCSKKTLQAIICGKIDAAAMVNTDGWRGYDRLVDIGFDRHFRVRHGIASFGSFARARLHPFKGVPTHTFCSI